MQAGRRALVLTVAIVASAGLAWKGSDLLRLVGRRTEIQSGQTYAIDCHDDQCVLDLDFSSSKRYLLIVGSLAPGTESHHISLASHRVDEVRIVPATHLEPLNPRPVSANLAERHGESREPLNMPPNGAAGSISANRREFSMHVTDGSPDDERQYARISAALIAEGDHVRVYLDSRQNPGELAPNLPDEIVRLFEDDVMPRCGESLGACRDVDGDGKFTILLSPWLSHLQGGRTSLGGFTREADFRADLSPPFSNRCDMIYLNSSVQCDSHLRTLLVHEFTHAVCFSVRTPTGDAFSGLPAEDDWLNEAIAHVSENLNGTGWTNLDYRISRYLSAPHDYPLVVDSYYQNGMWRNHGCRGATYLFLRWCADQYGDGLAHRLIRSPVHGTRSIEWATGRQFEDLYRRWTIALYQTGRRVELQFSDGATSAGCRMFERAEEARDLNTGCDTVKAKQNCDGYKSLDLRGPLADWGLAGPRAKTWNVDMPSEEIEARGTSSAFIELAAVGNPGARRLSIRGDYGTRLQVSLIVLPAEQSSLHAEATWDEWPTANSQELRRDAKSVHTLTVCAFNDVANSQVELIACERNYGETKESYCFSGDALRRLKRESQSSKSLPNCETFQLPIPGRSEVSSEAGPLVLKVVSRNTDGLRATSWATIDEPSQVAVTARAEVSSRRE